MAKITHAQQLAWGPAKMDRRHSAAQDDYVLDRLCTGRDSLVGAAIMRCSRVSETWWEVDGDGVREQQRRDIRYRSKLAALRVESTWLRGAS
jgi:hypothetical protein